MILLALIAGVEKSHNDGGVWGDFADDGLQADLTSLIDAITCLCLFIIKANEEYMILLRVLIDETKC